MGRKRKYTNSSVISIRISDQELEDLRLIMSCQKITRVSDLMRQAIELVKVTNSAAGSDQLPASQNFH